jgi:hypothetical protein
MRDRLVNKMVACEDGIITVTMPLDPRRGECPSFSFPGNEEAVIVVKSALKSLITTVFTDIFERMTETMTSPMNSGTYRFVRTGRRNAPDVPDIDTHLGPNLLLSIDDSSRNRSEQPD